MLPKAPSPQMTRDSRKDAFQFHYVRRTLTGVIPGLIPKLAIGIDRVLTDKTGNGSLMMIPVDLRNDLDEPSRQSTANLSLPIFLPVTKDATYWKEV